MSTAFARALMRLASAALGERRRDWAAAMEAEWTIAAIEGRALPFAAGCLLAAGRTMADDAEGRLAIAAHAVALGLLLPFAAGLVAGVIGGAPWPVPLAGEGAPVPPVNAGNAAALAPLALLVLLLGAGQVRLAWLVVGGDWARLAAVARLCLAAMATLTVFGAVVFARSPLSPAMLAAGVAEAAALAALARCHADLARRRGADALPP